MDGRIPPWLTSAAHCRALGSYLRAFPDAPPCDSYIQRDRERDSVPDFTRHHDGWGELVIDRQLPGGPGTLEDKLGFVRSMTRLYDGPGGCSPPLGQPGAAAPADGLVGAPVHAVHADPLPARRVSRATSTSMKARHAVAVESFLKRTMSIVPALIAEAIGQAASTL